MGDFSGHGGRYFTGPRENVLIQGKSGYKFSMPDGAPHSELEILLMERAAIKKREEELEKQCAELEAEIRAIRNRVKAVPETGDLAKP